MTLANSQLREYLNHLIVERGLSKNTIAAYRRDVERFISEGDVPDLTQVSGGDLEAFIARSRARGLAESSVARSVVAVRNAVEFTCKESKVLNQIKDVKPPKIKMRLPKALSISEIDSLLNTGVIPMP